METVVIAVHMMVAAAIVGLILLQQGKGAEMGASFGSGGSNTVFGPQGTGTVFSRATAILTAIFFATSIWLAIIAKDKIEVDFEEGIPSAEIIESVNQQVEEADIPVPADTGSSSDVPAMPDTGDVPTE